jgi:hypothetical protein
MAEMNTDVFHVGAIHWRTCRAWPTASDDVQISVDRLKNWQKLWPGKARVAEYLESPASFTV